ncbi:cAMP-dependent protein kinase subunit, partial [Perkinsus chesapeaki]
HLLSAAARPLAVIVLNSPLPRAGVMKRLWRDSGVRICADGGSNRLFDQFNTDLVPDVIIGDFDSVRKDVIESFRTAKVGEPVKYNTDLDKCLLYAAYHYDQHKSVLPEGDPLVAVAGSVNFAGRLDHTCSIINSLLTATMGSSKINAGEYTMRLPNKLRPILVDPNCLALVLPAGEHSLNLGRATSPSSDRRYYAGILPVDGSVESCSTEGFRWDCQDYRLEFGGIISACNQINEMTEVLKIINSDPVLFTMTVESEQVTETVSSRTGLISSSGQLEGFKKFYSTFTGRDKVCLPRNSTE